MKLCIIPARGGSKRIPYKNIRNFRGKPILEWSINAAKESKVFDKVIVSTDDQKIAEIASNLTAEIPFIRPKQIAGDLIGTTPVVQHAIEWYKNQGINVNEVCCLYATAPFVRSSDIKEGLSILKKNNNKYYVYTATQYTSPIERALRIECDSMKTKMINPKNFRKRSQDLEEAYHDAGQFYWGDSQLWLSNSNIFEKGIALRIPRWRVEDIDTEDDWLRAELMHRVLEELNGIK